MKRKNVMVCLLAVVLSASGLLTACGESKNEGDVKESVDKKNDSGVTEMELFMSKTETAEVMQKIADKFCEENPSVKISVTSTTDGPTVMQTRVARDRKSVV